MAPLDAATVRSDGALVGQWTMANDDSHPHPSGEGSPTRPQSEVDTSSQQGASVTNVKADAVDKLTDLNAEAEKAVKAVKHRFSGSREE
jgi:hypothetical protein